ncbi:MAG: pantetheine-phosphate adenylyltransferase [Actinobacteria bacterium]|nr:pantetheine-phosphate adenylyltransferase [Actinomycetota bacterium]
MTVAIYPGSFDPVTLGHLSVLKRAAQLFDELHVLVVHNPDKNARFSAPEREALLRESISELGISGRITVSSLTEGLMVEAAKRLNAHAIVKGFRTAGDIEYEIPMAQVNRDLSGIETVFLASEPGYGYVSSSLVKQVASLGGDVSSYVTKTVLSALS